VLNLKKCNIKHWLVAFTKMLKNVLENAKQMSHAEPEAFNFFNEKNVFIFL
jgi:hypothetical protein